MSQDYERNLAELWFTATQLERISYGPMRRVLANLFGEFGIDPFDAEVRPQPGTVQTTLIPDTPFQLTTEFSDRLAYNLARFMNVDKDLDEVDIHVNDIMVIVSATLGTKETS